MDLESVQNNTIAKLPILKQGDYEMWKLRIEHYIQLQDYALWEAIENGNFFKPTPRVTTNSNGTSTTTILGAVTTEEKIQKRNDVKARSILLMALSNEHQLTFNQYKDAKTFSESLDSIFNRLQKLVIQLSILGENISQEDLNLKFLRSLPAEWNTRVVVWRNKPDLESMSIDDLYNNFKIVKQEVKRSGSSSSNSGSKNMAFVSTPGSTNEDTAYVQVSTASTPISDASTNDNQIHDDDLEKIDLKWQLALLAIDGAGFDWSYMAEEEVPTNMALMALSNSEVYNDKTCSNTCLKSFETLKTQYDNLRIELNKSEFDLATYKRGLASVEEQLVFYKKNKVMFTDQIDVLKRDASFNESKIISLKMQIEKLKKDKENNLITIDNYENAFKSLDKLIGSQIPDNSRKGEFKQPEFEGYGPKVSDSNKDESVAKVLKSDNVQHKSEQAIQPRNVSQNPRTSSSMLSSWKEKWPSSFRADNMEIDGPNAKDLYSNSQHHLHLLIKGLGTKIENPSIDSVLVVPPKVDDPMLRTIKPKMTLMKLIYDDYYMSLFNDEEQPAKSSLHDLELQQEPDIGDVKDGILEQQTKCSIKGKTTFYSRNQLGFTRESNLVKFPTKICIPLNYSVKCSQSLYYAVSYLDMTDIPPTMMGCLKTGGIGPFIRYGLSIKGIPLDLIIRFKRDGDLESVKTILLAKLPIISKQVTKRLEAENKNITFSFKTSLGGRLIENGNFLKRNT
ncbi:hypothetical protein Tco_0445141 [Tanacetum coccineum]